MLRARWALLFPGNLRDGQPLWAREGESLVSWKLNPRSRNHGPQPERDRPLRRGLQDRGQCGASRHAPDEPAQLRWLPSLYCVRPDSSGACVELASVICLDRCVERAVEIVRRSPGQFTVKNTEASLQRLLTHLTMEPLVVIVVQAANRAELPLTGSLAAASLSVPVVNPYQIRSSQRSLLPNQLDAVLF